MSAQNDETPNPAPVPTRWHRWRSCRGQCSWLVLPFVGRVAVVEQTTGLQQRATPCPVQAGPAWTLSRPCRGHRVVFHDAIKHWQSRSAADSQGRIDERQGIERRTQQRRKLKSRCSHRARRRGAAEPPAAGFEKTQELTDRVRHVGQAADARTRKRNERDTDASIAGLRWKRRCVGRPRRQHLH